MPVLLGFGAVLALFVAVGLSARMRRRATTDDYLMAGRSVHPWLVGFAAASTNSSGFMFIGLIGATVRDGVSSAWLMVGWIAGDYLAWLVIHRRLRERSAELQVQSVPGFLAGSAAGGLPLVRAASALLTVVFLATYAAAQFVAGSKGLEALLGWPRSIGIIAGFAVLTLYCFSGGLRASIWVNTTQALLMIGSVALLLGTALAKTGGAGELWSRLGSLDPKYVDWRPEGLRFGFAAFLISWIAAGVGVIGQPHLMTIAMTVDHGDRMYRARRVYFLWYVLFSAGCILVGLCCRLLLNDLLAAGFDAEMALPQLARSLLPAVLVGIILGGLFAATMSTADTQIICSSAAITQELLPGWRHSYLGAKVGVLLTAGAVALTALLGPTSVFQLVVLSWSSLAAALGPLLAIQALRQPVNDAIGLTMILAGLGTALFWRYGLELSGSMYEVLPGMVAGFVLYGAARLLGYPVRRVDPEGAAGLEAV